MSDRFFFTSEEDPRFLCSKWTEKSKGRKREGTWEAVSVVQDREERDHTWMKVVELVRTDQVRGSV